MVTNIVCLVLGYLLGSIPFALVIGKVFYHTDVRKYGSGNLGGTNAGRVLGKKIGALVIVLDALKVVLAVGIAQLVSGSAIATWTGLICVVGHCWPVFAHFKGGKGIASMAGILVSMDWRVTLVCAALFLGAVILTRYVSLGSILVVISFFIQMLIYGTRGDYRVSGERIMEFFAVSFVLMAMAIWRHKTNIKRLLSGTENKLWGGKKTK